jgi:hypothetical protein
MPACGWTDDIQLGYIYTGVLNLVPYIYIYIYIYIWYILYYYPHIFMFRVYLSLHVIASQRIIKEMH